MRQKKDLSIYIHIPFCARKCAYCDFVSGVASKGEIEYYMNNLADEIRSFRALGNCYQIRTIFFGGGTPSLVDPMYLKNLLDLLRSCFIVAADVEITVECNPGTLNEQKLMAYRAMGVNRLSIGLQSADDEELKLLGRIHTWQDFLENYRLARLTGFRNINVDLISALPGQTLESWEHTLKSVAELEPEHISAYSLIIEEGTPFCERYSTKEGRKLLPDDDLDRAMYIRTNEILTEHGFHRYEISNYAREGLECRHNKVYWTGGEYVGFGMAACSCLQGIRFGNPVKYSEYWEYSKRAWAELQNMEPESRKNRMEEFMFLGLRMMRGISKKTFRERFGVPYEDIYSGVTRRWKKEGLLIEDGDSIRLSEQGIDVSNVVLADFLLDEEPEVLPETK